MLKNKLPNFIKCNMDATISPPRNEVNFSFTIFDHQGNFIGVKNGSLRCMPNLRLVETLACREALRWLKDKNLSRIVVETYCLDLYYEITQGKKKRFVIR